MKTITLVATGAAALFAVMVFATTAADARRGGGGLQEVVAIPLGGAPLREHREWRIGLQPCGGRLFTRRNECATHRSAGRTKRVYTSRWREKGTPLRNKNVTLRAAPFATKLAKRALAPRALWGSAQRPL